MLTKEQVKGKIKNIAKNNKADARILLRMYMMERFLERVAVSSHSDGFIIKGGILVTSMVGVSMRSTMDIDTTIRGINLTEEDVLPIIREICGIDLDDGVTFAIKEVFGIMDEMEYPGLRLAADAYLGDMVTPIKVDISTGDVITPRAVEYDYKLMLENRSIKLWSYNLETILAEKLQTVLARGTLNTRMRDFYDVYALMLRFDGQIDNRILKRAFDATCRKRGTEGLLKDAGSILSRIAGDTNMNSLWSSYRRKYEYASELSFEGTINRIEQLVNRIVM